VKTDAFLNDPRDRHFDPAAVQSYRDGIPAPAFHQRRSERLARFAPTPATVSWPSSQLPEDRRIRFRIGVNLGDVIVEEHDIFGDGVNVAARMEALAEPGGICISRVVRDQIRDKLPYPFEDRGEQSVKNIARPVRVFALRPE
jgi:class 3 adenylate cyclase